MMTYGDPECLNRLHHDLVTKDWFMALLDLDAYMDTRKKAYAAYKDQKNWAKMALTNIAMAGFFSSDRTIAQYNNDIWKLKDLDVYADEDEPSKTAMEIKAEAKAAKAEAKADKKADKADAKAAKKASK